nr:hypothetical protein GCM10025730_49590 [Promicromonospora thailandica]
MGSSTGNAVPEGDDPLRRWLGTVQARTAGLAASEAKVVALLLSDPLFVGTSTTAQVAARAGVSAPSVVRAARAVGFAGFAELKLEIARARGTAEFFAPPPTLSGGDPAAAVVETSIRTGTESLTALGGALDPAAAEEAVAVLRSAGQVIAFGAGQSGTVAADAVFRLRALGVPAVGIPDHESVMIATRLLRDGDAVLVVSSTGRTTTSSPWPTPPRPPARRSSRSPTSTTPRWPGSPTSRSSSAALP